MALTSFFRRSRVPTLICARSEEQAEFLNRTLCKSDPPTPVVYV